MTIGINGYEAVVPRFGYDKNGLPNRVGSGEISFEILKNLYLLDKKNKYKIFLPISPTSDMPREREGWEYVILPSQKLWTATALTKRLFSKKDKLDVFFSPTHYLPLYVGCSSMVSILDLSYIHFPQLFNSKDKYQLKFWGRYSANKASKVFTISEASKNDIINYYKISGSKVSVIYPGIKEMQSNSSVNIKDKYKIEREYILFVGTLQPRKNIVRLIESMSEIKDKYVELVIVGKRGWMYEDILNAPKKYGVEENVRFLENVPDEDLPLLYKKATCFILPSLYEGFGLPVLEAMQNGCPVIASRVSSLPEAGGEAAVYINPLDTLDIAAKIDKVVSDADLRKKMIEKGYEQVKKFNWKKTAEETLKVLESMVQNA